PGVIVESGDLDPEIRALTADSREVENGSIFAALAGSLTDGRDYIDQAIAKGAVAILADPSLQGRDFGRPLILDPNPRRRLALMAARFFGRQPENVVAITGTNGKTSVAGFTRQLWQGLGYPAAALGTLGLDAPGHASKAGLTTPDPVMLHQLLAELADGGIQHLALEASSHGLDQHRLDGVALKAAAFTNLSRDHFDYHGSVDAYFKAKARLFGELLHEDGIAVLNADSPEFDRLGTICRDRGIKLLAYGREAADIKLAASHPRDDGQNLTLDVQGRRFEVETELMGGFQAENLMAALGLVMATSEAPIDRQIETLSTLQGAPGRMQRVDGSPKGVSVFVDYAHTPDALAHVLGALRPHTKGVLMAVFGCGGDRDPGKRAQMGEIAASMADKVVVTDDNPRHEDAESIRRAILDACPGAIEIGDRAQAIHLAVRMLGVGDVLVVAGKGHETGQIVGRMVLPFDDVAVTKAAIEAGIKAALVEANGADPDDRAVLMDGCGR
ncbi:MAG: UDP-N-acetylmuramoyl-L-alanyl-D-glutamate--2,6-diaminopimelate ligase, partial [Geminicoccaceae bacterium]